MSVQNYISIIIFPITVPLKPTNISYVASVNTFVVEWMATGPEATYRIHTRRMGSPQTATFKPVTPPYNITGLDSNTEYTVVVEAYNSLGSANGSTVGYTLPEGEILFSKQIEPNSLI